MNGKSLNFKIGIIIFVLSIGGVVIAYLGLSKMGQLNDSLHAIVHKNAARVSLAKEVKSVFFVQVLNERNFMMAEDKELIASIEASMEKRHKEMSANVDALYEISTDIGKKELTEFKSLYNQFWTLSAKLRGMVEKGQVKEAFALSQSDGRPLRKRGEEIISVMTERNEKSMKADSEAAEAAYNTARILMLAISASTILFGISIAAIVLTKLSKSINEVITSLTDNSAQVAQASQQIATASVELSQSSTEQAASLEETTAALETLVSMVTTNTNNTQEVARLSQNTNNIAADGEVKMKSLVDSMNDISSDSKKIEEIITVIDSIAFQTNLLALNASVEAARAGEQGKGFAVVAEAVRALAQKSALAAKDINTLIKSSVDKIERGSQQAGESSSVLTEILVGIKKMDQLNSQIADASSEQSNGLSQITKAMNQLDQTTQVNAASSEEAAASAEELSAQAESLSQMVDVLVTVIKGKRAEHTQSEVVSVKSNKKVFPMDGRQAA
jgi:Methyl-accepting chemotaxis protein